MLRIGADRHQGPRKPKAESTLEDMLMHLSPQKWWMPGHTSWPFLPLVASPFPAAALPRQGGSQIPQPPLPPRFDIVKTLCSCSGNCIIHLYCCPSILCYYSSLADQLTWLRVLHNAQLPVVNRPNSAPYRSPRQLLRTAPSLHFAPLILLLPLSTQSPPSFTSVCAASLLDLFRAWSFGPPYRPRQLACVVVKYLDSL